MRCYWFQFEPFVSSRSRQTSRIRDTNVKVWLRRVPTYPVLSLLKEFHELVLCHPKLSAPKAAHKQGDAV